MNINVEEIRQKSQEQFLEDCSLIDEFLVDIPTCIGSSGSHLPIAEDFLIAWFIGESLVNFATKIRFSESFDPYNRMWIHFEISPKNKVDFCNALYNLALPFDDNASGEELERFWDDLEKFRKQSSLVKYEFPELGDSYWANYIEGFYDLGDELREIYGTNPEFLLHFWESCFSGVLGFCFYASPYALLVSQDNDFIAVLKAYFGIMPKELEFSPSFLFAFAGNFLIINQNVGPIMISYNNLISSQECGELVFGIQSNFNHVNFNYVNYSINDSALIEDADILLVRSENYIIIIPECKKLSQNDTDDLLGSLTKFPDFLVGYTNRPISINCPWERLDDEIFEQLCYDIVAKCGKFDADTIQKMGKSRSRDGGRDIQVISKSLPGTPSKKWIVQCKKIKANASLSGSKINISDTIDQYGAEGYCIMTSGLVDATIYDKLEGISRNRKIEYKVWSVMEIERFLTQHPEIKLRYFGH